MINVTVWYEALEEKGELRPEFVDPGMPEEFRDKMEGFLKKSSAGVAEAYPDGLLNTLSGHLRKNDDMNVTYTTLYDSEYGLPDELLDKTDVLIWWGHMAHHAVPDELAFKVVARVQRGMGFIALHSAHLSKPFRYLLGTSGNLKWREVDFTRVYNLCPTHPITQGVPEYFELEREEVYCECFDVPKPDDLLFTNWYRGGEIFRSGATWTRGNGKIFYFQPGHETFPSYHNPIVIKIIENAVRWAAPVVWKEKLESPMIEKSPEELLK